MSYLSKWSSNKKSKVSSASSFWADEWSNYDDDVFAESYYDDEKGVWATKKLSSSESSTVEMLRLSAHRRAIANFVNILTNKSIPVKFYKKGDSYTNGQYVVLSAEVKPEKFDVAVGLALHEASHINLTNFNTFSNYSVPQTLRELFESKNVHNGEVWNLVKNLTNWIEDRRIDQFIFDTCPGYRDYYRALYDEYFNDKVIDKGIISDEFTDENIESYMFRIINLTNPNTKLNKLKGLAKIYSLVDLKNIGRLKTTTDSLLVAEQIAEIICKAIDTLPQSPSQPQSSGQGEQDKDGEPQQTEGNGGQGDSDVNEDVDNDASNDEQSPSMGGGSMQNQPTMGGTESDEDNGTADGDKDDANGKSKSTLADNVKKQLQRKIQNQKDFVNNNIKKKSITKKDEQLLDSVEKSGTELVSVGGEQVGGVGFLRGTQCIVSKKMTEELMQDRDFPFADWYKGWGDMPARFSGYNEAALRKGIQLGTLLGKRLAVRSEERVTDNPRQKSGKIDRRLIAGLGYDYVNVFSTKDVDKYKKANLHISLDGSGSMSGSAWNKALTTTIAICKAASMVSNLEVQVTIRGIWGRKAYICQAYDSRVDKFDKVKRLFPALHANGTTPEGLCYEAIMKYFVPTTKDIDSYFLNICDGEPNFSEDGTNYYGNVAVEHTRKMVKKMKEQGINVMAYFVSDYGASGSSETKFKRMYGEDSRFIDIENIVPITKTLNELFLKK
jgi:hypothetical protein